MKPLNVDVNRTLCGTRWFSAARLRTREENSEVVLITSGAPIRSDSHMTFITVRRVSISFIILRWMNSCVVCRTGAETIFLSERRALLPFCLWVLGELQTDDLGKCQRCHFYHFFNLSCWTLSRDSFTALLGKQIKRWCVFGILRVSWLKWECILDAGTSWT